MTQFKIYEGNIDRLEQKITRIRNKCNRYGCDFYYARVGEEYVEDVDENKNKFFKKFILVEAEGTAKINGWEFVGTIEHLVGGHNIIRNTTNLEVPERYLTTECICEHCNSKRSRKDTYLVHNIETNEFKQVGSSCLCDFTGGLSAEMAASYLALFDELAEGEAPYSTATITQYTDLHEIIAATIVAVDEFGYVKSDPFQGDNQTKIRVRNYLNNTAKDRPQNFSELMEAAGPEADTIIDYYKNIEIEGYNDYLQNLKTFATAGVAAARDYGYVVSMVPSYRRDVERREITKKREEAHKLEAAHSEYYGEIGQKVKLHFNNCTLVTTSDSQFGTSYLYKFIDEAGRIFTWWTSNIVYKAATDIVVSGTIKAHTEFRDVKQTELTRCRVSYPTLDALADKIRKDARESGFPEDKMYDLDWILRDMYIGEITAEKITEMVHHYIEKHVEA